jgi:hypothetical protein
MKCIAEQEYIDELQLNSVEEQMHNVSTATTITFINQGIACIHQQQFTAAIAYFTQALNHDPSMLYACVNRAGAYAALIDYSMRSCRSLTCCQANVECERCLHNPVDARGSFPIVTHPLRFFLPPPCAICYS